MTPHDDGTPGDSPGRPALRRLVSVDDATFSGRHWAVAPLVSAAGDLPGSFDDLFSEDAVDELVSSRGLRTPFLRMAKEGRTLDTRDFTAPGGIGAGIGDQVSDDRLLAQFADGATMVLQGLHRTWGPLVGFCQQLAADLGHPVQANAYVTPAQNRGFDDHYDVHDVFVMQVAGEKRWRVRPPVLDAPLRDQGWEQRRSAVREAAAAEPLLEFTLKPGDCLYLPRGFLHSATALGGTSTHLTLGVHPWTARTLAEVVAERALDVLREEPAARGSLPFGVDVGDPDQLAGVADAVRASLATAVQQVPDADLAEVMLRRRRSSQRAAPLQPLRQLADSTTVSAGDLLEVRAHLDASVVESGAGARLRSRAGDLDLGAAEDLARRLVSSGTTEVGEGEQDAAATLLRAGIAVRRPRG